MTTFQLFSGNSVRDSKNDTLTPISMTEVFRKIAAPEPALSELVNKLRIMYTIDKRKYADMKVHLPYIIAASFKSHIRNTSNFEKIDGFFIDLDELPSHGIDPATLTDSLKNDERIVLLFRSPGGYGLKLLFQLANPIYNTKQFTDFYKAFTLRFARQYQLEKVLDFKTSDVTRICFLSVDHHAYMNTAVTLVEVSDYITTDPHCFTDDVGENISFPEVEPKEQNTIDSPVKSDSIIPRQVMHDISKLLSPNPAVIKQPKSYYVPPQLDRIEGYLEPILQEQDIRIAEAKPIQYGKQLRFISGNSFAEINIFFGKNGFSIVKTTRKGYDPTLCNHVLNVLSSCLIYAGSKSTV